MRPLMTGAAISIRDLQKTYAGGKRALDGVSIEVPRGQIFGLLGPNGAGKSTLINILSGMVRKTGGSAEIWGFDIDASPRNAKRSIGIVPQEILFDPFFTPFETLELQAGLYGISKGQRRSLELLRAVRLEDKAAAYSRTLSGGMKRRLLVAKAMVHSPPILVLDEPPRASTSSFASSSGICPLAQRRASPWSSPPIISRKPSSCATASRSSTTAS
jgi:ABC-2 type transport system ATP-binding protein